MLYLPKQTDFECKVGILPRFYFLQPFLSHVIFSDEETQCVEWLFVSVPQPVTPPFEPECTIPVGVCLTAILKFLIINCFSDQNTITINPTTFIYTGQIITVYLNSKNKNRNYNFYTPEESG